MSYAALSDLQTMTGEKELVQLTDRADPPSDQVDVAVVAKALTDADEIINGYVAAQYSLPLAATPPILVGVACDIARYRLWKDRASAEVRTRYEDAIKLLKDISRGALKLPDVAGVEPPARSGMILTSGEPRLFSRASMRNF